MPQMMPLSWLMLMVFFSMTFMLFNFMNYFQMMPKPKKKEIKILSNLMPWKW
uniref:ATP synthase complex subunit 8 n=1 Tax=Lamproblatta albipalpus TaxID=1080993 RepID=A0A2P1H9U1_9NEOP|nr:ATP synthase F0 subunit 8 [Lamproblatta albipalpus]